MIFQYSRKWKHKGIWAVGQINLFSLHLQLTIVSFGSFLGFFFIFLSVLSEWIYLMSVKEMFSLEKWWHLNGAETRSHLLWEINSLTDMQISFGRFQVYLEENVVEACCCWFYSGFGAVIFWYFSRFWTCLQLFCSIPIGECSKGDVETLIENRSFS